MKTRLIAISTAAVMGLGAPALAQDAFHMGHNMMVGSVYSSLQREGIPTDGISDLSLNELVQVKALLDEMDGSADTETRLQIDQIFGRE